MQSLASPAAFFTAGKQISKSFSNTQSHSYLAKLCETAQQHWKDPKALMHERKTLNLYLEDSLYRLLGQPFRFLFYKETCSHLHVSTDLLYSQNHYPISLMVFCPHVYKYI